MFVYLQLVAFFTKKNNLTLCVFCPFPLNCFDEKKQTEDKPEVKPEKETGVDEIPENGKAEIPETGNDQKNPENGNGNEEGPENGSPSDVAGTSSDSDVSTLFLNKKKGVGFGYFSEQFCCDM